MLIKRLFKPFIFIMLALMGQVIFAAEQPKPQIIKSYKMSQYDGVIKKIYQDNPKSHAGNINKRLIAVSGVFLGKPYVLGSLGEGKNAKFDQDPLYRTDEFDCNTYVSVVLAIIEADDLQDFQQNILNIRYRHSVPKFSERNHFTSVDWNPANQANGILKDVTQELFPQEHHLAIATINRPAWFQQLDVANLKLLSMPKPNEITQLMEQLHDIAKVVHKTKNELSYVPLTALFDKNGKPNMGLFNRIPSGVVIEIVRPNWNLHDSIGTNLNISHMGFGIRINGKLLYREASSIEHKVIDIPLPKYLSNYLTSSTVKGIHIEKII